MSDSAHWYRAFILLQHLRYSTQIVTFKTHDGAGAGLTMGTRVQLLPDFARALWFGADGRTLNAT